MLADELIAVLTQTAKAQKMSKFEVRTDMDQELGEGFMGQIYTGEIWDSTKQNRLDVVIKRTQIHDKDLEALYENEVVFYTLVLKSLGNFRRTVPTLYHHNSLGNSGYLVMENLRKIGFQLFPRENPFDPKHLRLIFRTFARFHAGSFLWRSRDPQEYHLVHREYQDLHARRLEVSARILEHSTEAALRHLEPSSQLYRDLEELPPHLLPILLKASEYRGRYGCSVHGDCWSNNLMFRYAESGEPVEVKLIDFQLARHSTPIHDLAYFFYSGASATELDRWEDYLQDYHNLLADILRENGLENDEIVPYQALKEEWREYGVLGLIYGIHFWEIKLTPKNRLADDMKVVEEGNMDKLVEVIGKFGKTVAGEAFRDRVVPLLFLEVLNSGCMLDTCKMHSRETGKIPVALPQKSQSL